jgi:hypothetical protein
LESKTINLSIKGFVIKIIDQYSKNSLKLICITENFGRFEVWISRKDFVKLNIEEGFLILFKVKEKTDLLKKNFHLDCEENFLILSDFDSLLKFIDKNQNNIFDPKKYKKVHFHNSIEYDLLASRKIFVIKIICEMINKFIFNIDEISFLFKKLNLVFEFLMTTPLKLDQIIRIFLFFEFWILFFLLDSQNISCDLKNKKFLDQKKISIIYKKFLKKNLYKKNQLSESKNLNLFKEIFIYFEKNTWNNLLKTFQEKTSSNLKIQNFLKKERKFLFDIFFYF